MKDTARSYIFLAIGLAVIVLLSFPVQTLDNYDRQIVIFIGINMILAASLNLINGFTGQFSLGHAGFMAIGAYASAAATKLVIPKMMEAAPEGFGQDGVFLVALLFGGLVAAIAGLAVGVPSLRLKGDYLAIVTLGFGEIIRVIFQNVKVLGGSLGLSGIPSYTTFNWVFIVVAVLVFITQNMMRSTYGKGFLAVRDDEVAAEAVGVNTTRYKVVAFIVGAFFAGVAGGLYAHFNGLIEPAGFGFLRSVEIVVIVILGGMGSTWGVLFAAAVLTYLPEWLREQDFQVGGMNIGDFRLPIYALVLVILMLTRPQGLFGDFSLKRSVQRFRTRRQEPSTTLEG